MTQTAQIGDSAAQRPSLLLDATLPAFAQHSGLLGNRWAQAPAVTNGPEEEVWLLDLFRKQFASAQPASKLAIFKRYKFTAEGREQRIKASLDALDSPQPTTLTAEQWKEVVAEAEEDADDED
jgi:hypothetical protein